jgi:glycosyltransferase involved in cell wall biosynthesis
VVPLFPSEIIENHIPADKPASLDVQLNFIHYPAQYWAHKNHYNLLLAFAEVLVKHPGLKLILTGSDRGNKEYVKRVITDAGLNENVIDLGFVSTAELKWLYQNSQGLVMPTFLGPTNMPLLEAAELGCPVACSQLDGHKEQLGDYGYYFDPKDPQDISRVIGEMIDDNTKKLTRTYISKFNIQNAVVAIDEAFSALAHIRLCWGKNDQIF